MPINECTTTRHIKLLQRWSLWIMCFLIFFEYLRFENKGVLFFILSVCQSVLTNFRRSFLSNSVTTSIVRRCLKVKHTLCFSMPYGGNCFYTNLTSTYCLSVGMSLPNFSATTHGGVWNFKNFDLGSHISLNWNCSFFTLVRIITSDRGITTGHLLTDLLFFGICLTSFCV